MAYTFGTHKNRIAMRSDLTLMLTHLTRPKPAKPATSTSPAEPAKSALDVLVDILTTHTIRGSGHEGKISGPNKAVCFQNTPLYHLAQMFFQEREIRLREVEKAKAVADELDRLIGYKFIDPKGMNYVNQIINQGRNPAEPEYRYTLYGITFPMRYIWDNSGRPVIYEESDYAKDKMLTEDHYWRVVDLDLTKEEEITDWTHEREWRIKTDVFDFDLRKAVVVLPDDGAYHQFLADQRAKDAKLLENIAGIVMMSPLFD